MMFNNRLLVELGAKNQELKCKQLATSMLEPSIEYVGTGGQQHKSLPTICRARH